MSDRDCASTPPERGDPPFRNTERMMMATINEAIESAARAAREESPSVATRLRTDYFADVALHLLFLKVCGADPETQQGGSSRRAARALHIGRRIASQWGDREPDVEDDAPHREDVSFGAHRAALRLVIQILVEQASAADPQVRGNLQAAVEAYLEKLAPQSETERDFAEQVQAFAAMFARPPASRLTE
jgi:hypothetical protein